MRLTASRTRLFTLRNLRKHLLPWAIALAVGIDYFDNTIFSFFTSYIAGGINASPTNWSGRPPRTRRHPCSESSSSSRIRFRPLA